MHTSSAFRASSVLRSRRTSSLRLPFSSCNSSLFVLTNRSYFVKTITTGADSMNTNQPRVRGIAGVVARNALPVSWTRRSNLSSPVSNIRPPALGVSVHSLKAVSSAQSRLQENPHHTAWSRSLRGSFESHRCRMNLSTSLNVLVSPASNPLESCRTT